MSWFYCHSLLQTMNFHLCSCIYVKLFITWETFLLLQFQDMCLLKLTGWYGWFNFVKRNWNAYSCLGLILEICWRYLICLIFVFIHMPFILLDKMHDLLSCYDYLLICPAVFNFIHDKIHALAVKWVNWPMLIFLILLMPSCGTLWKEMCKSVWAQALGLMLCLKSLLLCYAYLGNLCTSWTKLDEFI